MFTGIIQELGKVVRIERKSGLSKIGVLSKIACCNIKIGDSIAIDGVCLTAVENKKDIVFFEAIKETLEATTLKRLKVNTLVNLESALKVGDKLGGHFVLGHIDCESKIKSIKKTSRTIALEVKYPLKFSKLIVDKGSISIDGISLTIQKKYSSFFSVNIIPHTFNNTNLKYKRVGDFLNLEFDYLLKRS